MRKINRGRADDEVAHVDVVLDDGLVDLQRVLSLVEGLRHPFLQVARFFTPTKRGVL